jgi:hypothetical protein
MNEPILIAGRLHLVRSLAQCIDEPSKFKYFSVQGVLSYHPFYDDFGPMSLSNITSFCSLVDMHLNQNPKKLVALQSLPDRRSLSNSVFLMGCYMIMKLGMRPEEVESRFGSLQDCLASFRDVSVGKQNFDLFVKDCWEGLWKAKTLSWVDVQNEALDPDEHIQLGGSLNGGLHEIVPGKFIAMRGPKDIPSAKSWRDVHDASGRFLLREFSPSFYLDIFSLFKVQVASAQRSPAACRLTRVTTVPATRKGGV